jgi:hypothetical protein
MQFLVLAYDGTDEEAPSRRQRCRDAHLARIDQVIAAGQLITAGAMLDNDGIMRGSMLVVDFASRQELDAWLAVWCSPS